jgi:hypothetical protein
MALQRFVRPLPPFQFLDLLGSRYDPLDGGSTCRKAATCTQNFTNKRTQTPKTQVGFEFTISVFERAKTVHALDHAATVIGCYRDSFTLLLENTGDTLK